MDNTALLQGLHVPLVTPFTADGQIEEAALTKLAHSALDDGAAGLVALGTTAETAVLDAEEQRLVLDVCAAACTDRGATLIAGAGSNDTRASARSLRELAVPAAVDAALVAVPAFTRPSEDGVVAHFVEIAAQSPVPIVVYNVPYRSGRALSAEALRRLAAIPGVAGVKHAAGAIDEVTMSLLGDAPDGFSVLAGDDLYASPLLALGASGAVLASANVDVRAYADLVSAWQAGKAERARVLGHGLAELSVGLFAEPNPSVIKGVLHRQGRIPSPAVRLPLLPATDASVDRAWSLLR